MEGPQPYIVTLDVNIYLTVARMLGPGFTDEQFMDRVSDAGPHDTDVFALFQGLMKPYPDGGLVEVWTGQHIIETALHKARQHLDGPTVETSGLGWTEQQSQSIANLILGIQTSTHGGFVIEDGTYLYPPLDYEDGCVMQCAKTAHSDLNLCHRYCITNDYGMIDATRGSTQVKVVSPQTWCIKRRMVEAERSLGNASTFMRAIHDSR